MLSSVLGLLMLVGSYGSEADTTFHTYEFDCDNGTAAPLYSFSGMVNPSFLAVADSGRTVLAVNETATPTASITMLRRKSDDPNAFIPVATQAAEGSDPCHIAVSPDGRYAVSSNYSGGSISIFDFDGDEAYIGKPTLVKFDGSGPVAGQQATPHAHFTTFTPDGKLMIVDDLGTDRLHTFPLDANGRPQIDSMIDVVIAPASGPRHLAFDRSGTNAYLINEISGTVTHLKYDPAELTLTPVSYILADYRHGHGSADIHISPDGRFVYASNRLKGDGIAYFAVNPADGSLTAAGFTPTGIHPRNFAITPDGRWLLVACRDDNRIEVYRRDSEDGSLTHTSDIPCHKPVCIIFN